MISSVQCYFLNYLNPKKVGTIHSSPTQEGGGKERISEKVKKKKGKEKGREKRNAFTVPGKGTE